MALETEKVVRQSNGLSIHTNKTVYVPRVYTDVAANKKEAIINILSESDQLNMLATVLEQIGDAIGLDTPEFTAAKSYYASIKDVLNG